MVYAPIWKDTVYTANTASLEYSITVNGTEIYSGKAVRFPNESNLSININKICKDYLFQDIDNILTGATSQTNSYAYRTFTLKNGNGTTLETYGFLYDWEKGRNWNGTARTLVTPINGERTAGMLCLKTTVSSSRVVTTYSNSTPDYPKLVCADYALYFLGLGGGWSSFVFTGKCKRVDNITSHQFDHSYNNTTSEFEVGRYISEIVPTWELNTGMLTEEQAADYARELVSSNKCYLHNLVDNTIIPVVITDNAAEYKTEDGEDVIIQTTRVKASQITIRQ